MITKWKQNSTDLHSLNQAVTFRVLTNNFSQVIRGQIEVQADLCSDMAIYLLHFLHQDMFFPPTSENSQILQNTIVVY